MRRRLEDDHAADGWPGWVPVAEGTSPPCGLTDRPGDGRAWEGRALVTKCAGNLVSRERWQRRDEVTLTSFPLTPDSLDQSSSGHRSLKRVPYRVRMLRP